MSSIWARIHFLLCPCYYHTPIDVLKTTTYRQVDAVKNNKFFGVKSRNLCIPIALIFGLVSQACFAGGTAIISNGNISIQGTGVWINDDKNEFTDPEFPWGDKGTYVRSHSLPMTLTVNVDGNNPDKNKYVLLGNFNTEINGKKSQLDVSLAADATLTAALFAFRNDKNSANNGNVNLKGASGSVLKTPVIVGADAGRQSASFFQANNNIVNIVGPFKIEGTGEEVLITGGKAEYVNFNQVTIDGTTLDLKTTSTKSKISGGSTMIEDPGSTSSFNRLVIKNSPEVNADIVVGGSSGGLSQNNTLTLENSKVEADLIVGGKSVSGVAKGNIVNISGSDIKGNVYGGYSGSGSANENTVNLSSGTIKGEVYGGYSQSGLAENNNVNLSGKGSELNLSEASLIGGNGNGNSLEVSGWTGNVANVNSFNNITFKNVDWVPSGTAVNVTGKLQDLSKTNVLLQNHYVGNDSVFDINFADGTEHGYMFLIRPNKIEASPDYQILQRGWVQDGTLTQKRAGVLRAANSAFVVIEPDPEVKPEEPENPGEEAKPDDPTNPGEGTTPEEPDNPGGGDSPDNPDKPVPGESEEVPYPPEVSGPDNPPPSVEDIFPGGPQPAKPNTQVTIINDSREASITFVNQGTDHVLSVLDSFDPEERQGIRTFASVYGQVAKYKGTDSIRMKATSMVAGVGDQRFFGQDKFEWGVFAEAGIGNYNTANHFRGHDLRGNGHANYAGAGLTMRYFMQNGLYGETAFRAGHLQNKLDNGILHKDGTSVSYKVNSYYLSTIVGAGYRFNLGENNTVSVGTRYLYGRYGSDTVDIGDNDYRFEAVNSHRVQLLTSITHKFPNNALVKAAVIGEREFDGKTRNSVDGIKSPGKGFGGNTLIGDLSALIKPAKDVSVETRFRGFVGKRQGVSAKILVNYYW